VRVFPSGRIAHINISPKFVGRYILLYILDFCRAIKITIIVPNNKHENIVILSSSGSNKNNNKKKNNNKQCLQNVMLILSEPRQV